MKEPEIELPLKYEIPEGYIVLPMESTDEMKQAVCRGWIIREKELKKRLMKPFKQTRATCYLASVCWLKTKCGKCRKFVKRPNGAVSMSLSAPCSPVWVRVGDFDVCTYVDAEHQQRCAEMQLRGWERLGCPKCAFVRPANAGADVRPSGGDA